MSYCRWSDEDFQCDVYCYEDSHGGWTTHVAGRRTVLIGPLPERVDPRLDLVGWATRHRIVAEMVEKAELRPIDLPHAGASFTDDTIEDFLLRLEELKQLGYNVPEYVFDEVRQEIAEREKAL